MKQRYIINKGFYVKDDLKSFLFCFDYFNHGLVLPKIVDTLFSRKLAHFFARFVLIVMYQLGLFTLLFKHTYLDEDAVVIFKGIGAWANTVSLIKAGNHYKILKQTKDSEAYKRERTFYEKYKNTNSLIALPKFLFKTNNTIEIEFLKEKSFQRLIRDGSMKLEEALSHYNIIKNELYKLYKSSKTTIHGDLCPENIYIHNGKYYLIDFTDSHDSSIFFDLYTLLERILYTYPLGISNKISLHIFSNKGITFQEMLGVNGMQLAKVEADILYYKKKRFPEWFL